MKNFKIEDFIINFKKGHIKEDIESIFLNGNCYHFALILHELFGGYIVYDYIIGHFMLLFDYKYYDITGEIVNVNKEHIKPWLYIQSYDKLWAKNIKYNCIYKDTKGWEEANE